jgi:hypothetical protein
LGRNLLRVRRVRVSPRCRSRASLTDRSGWSVADGLLLKGRDHHPRLLMVLLARVIVIVGYGVTEQDKISGNPIGRWNDPTDRVMATSALVSGTQSGSEGLLKHQNGPGGGSGGGCFHDSGGPILLPGSTTVLAINAFVNNANCTGIGYGTRLDTTEHLAWIGSLP